MQRTARHLGNALPPSTTSSRGLNLWDTGHCPSRKGMRMGMQHATVEIWGCANSLALKAGTTPGHRHWNRDHQHRKMTFSPLLPSPCSSFRSKAQLWEATPAQPWLGVPALSCCFGAPLENNSTLQNGLCQDSPCGADSKGITVHPPEHTGQNYPAKIRDYG